MKVGKKFFVVFVLINIVMIFVYINNFEVRAAHEKGSGGAGGSGSIIQDTSGDSYQKEDVVDESLLDRMQSQASGFLEEGKKGEGSVDTSSITKDFVGLGQILTMIGAGVMVAVVSYMGIKYIMSPPDKQAALKQQLIGVVVAGIVIFGAYGIWSAILSVVSNF